MQELSMQDVNEVSGAGLSFSEGGAAIIALGLCGTVATGGFGLLVGGACLLVGYYQN
ncbi:hypothetical protein [Dyella japonica]|uniref:Class IIb bacteriocin, lactobin A/cerein 7B family n=1 Tax=Dyella japonica TaxID=231455 RepID=A0ABV2K1C3_9GAMM